ncbi:hypothetical protein BLOT_000790 [Blomia tropicalis]|nr:hypothetical protein BLOT_000790 [Blomia tropicalis]
MVNDEHYIALFWLSYLPTRTEFSSAKLLSNDNLRVRVCSHNNGKNYFLKLHSSDEINWKLPLNKIE